MAHNFSPAKRVECFLVMIAESYQLSTSSLVMK